jgi:lysophospholipase L1-like esterase
MLITLNGQGQITWTGKKNVFIGDSNTEGVYYNSAIAANDNYGANRFSSAFTTMKGGIEDNQGAAGRVMQNATAPCVDPEDAANISLIPEKDEDHLFLYIMLGSNDIAHNTGAFQPELFQATLDNLVSGAQTKGWPLTNIVLISPPWASTGSTDEPDGATISGAYDVFYDYCGIANRIDEARQQAYADAVRTVAEANNVVFVDLYTAMKDHPNRSSLFSEANNGYDRIHLSAAGHQFVANTLANFVYPEALPLTLLDFAAQKQNASIQLSWTTENEVNTKEFIVERADSRQQFKAIGKRQASGNSSSQLSYQFRDNQPLPGNNLYRLKMIDVDGQYKYSKTAMVNMNNKASYSISPNPAKDNITLLVNKNGPLILQVIDINGKIVKTNFLLGSVHNIDVSDLKKGLYLIRLNMASETYTEKLIVN